MAEAWTEAQMSAHYDNAKIVWDFLQSKGLNNIACAAVMGNIERESHFDSSAVQDNKDGHGLCQWSGTRRTALLNKAQTNRKHWSDINFQLNFMWEELITTHKSALKELQSATDVEKATIAFEKSYEKSSVKVLEERVQYANYWYKTFKDSDTNNSNNITVNGNIVRGGGVDTVNGNNIVIEEAEKEESFFKYFDNELLNISDELSIAMMDELVKVDPLRRIEPLHKLDYIGYGHRYYNSIYTLTLGDCSFVIPPQAISIISESNGQELITLRQENTQKIKNGYSKRTISIELVFHGYNQINGYKVEGPDGYYYVDGLRQLLAQFKCTPFLPIDNYTINSTYNIHTVALQSIVCSTVEGFPDMMIANLTLQEVDLFPYLEVHSMLFSDFIDWDLFRFYYQRLLTEKHEYGKLQSIPVDKTLNKFKISILNKDIFNDKIEYKSWEDWGNTHVSAGGVTHGGGGGKRGGGNGRHGGGSSSDVKSTNTNDVKSGTINYDTDNLEWTDENYNTRGEKAGVSFYDIVLDRKIVYFDSEGKPCIEDPSEEHPSNFNTYIDSDTDNIHIATFQCGYSNILTNIQMAEHAHPTVQYMGGMDTMFNITFETTNEDIVTALERCNIDNNSLTRDHQDCSSLGFVKLESELVELFGSKFVMIDNVVTHTVPDFPGLFICQINCVSFDVYQRDTEGVHGMSPFEKDGTGTKENAISQTPDGLKEKVKQDLCVENKLRTLTNLYPDLNLPTYKEVDEFIPKIKAFRKNHKNIDGSALGEYPIDKYPRTPQRMLHGISEITNIEIDSYGFVTNVPDIIENSKWYEGYVDPDFYVFYPASYKEMMDSTEEDRIEAGAVYNNRTPEPKTTTITKTKVTSDKTTDSNISNYDYELYSKGATELQIEFIAKAKSKIGKPYSNANSGYYNRTGPNAYDCSGLVGQCLYEMGVISNPKITTSSITSLINSGVLKQKWKVSNKNNINELVAHANPGDLLHIYNTEKGTSMGHIAIYIGDNKIIHASSSKNQVCEIPVYKEFMRVLEVPALLKGGSENIKQETKVNTEIKKSSSKTTLISGADANYITESEITAIAKTIANIQSGKPYSSQVALAQLVYDRLTDKKAKYGNLNDVLNSPIFKGQCNKVPTGSTVTKAVEEVFCNGKRAFPNKQLVNYLGFNSGNTDEESLNKKYKKVGEIGDFTFWANDNTPSSKRFILVDDDTDNKTVSSSTIEEVIEMNTAVIDLSEEDANFVKMFGKPVLVKSSEMDGDLGWFVNGLQGKTGNQEKAYKENYNTSVQTLMTSFVNQCEYSGKGRLVKAFPTYLFCIVDEDGNWLDGRKLWANYYALRSVADIQVASYNDSPVSTATITVTNSYGNLDTLPPNAFYYSPANDSEYNKFQQIMYKWFGMLPGFGPKLTQTLVDQKNIIYDSMQIRAGSRMHLRMGYGSDPLSLPIVMNGYISDLQVGDITQFVCVSDGVELTNAIISDNPKDVNGIFQAQESSNVCIDLITSRQAVWLNRVNNKWGEPNKFGIEHFGLYMSEHIDFIPTVHLPEIEVGDNIIANSFENTVNINGDIIETMVNAVGTTSEAILNLGRGVADNFIKAWREIQYDMVKNIYRSSYSGSLAMYSPFWGFADNEKNFCFNLYNKTPWDAIVMATMNAPEYIGMPMYHQFESRLFFGLPWFLVKYRYNLINGELYEEAKAYAQCHFIDSLSEIIDNQMVTTSRDVCTNSIIMYTLGHSPKASPTLYSDKSINFSQQSTKIFDSSVSQNIIGPDQIYEWIQIDIGKQAACRTGVTQLLWNWSKAYQGDIILLGDAGINPDDYIYLNDRFNNLTGLCTARTVIHSLSAKTGFITTINPGMIGMSTEQNSQALTTLTNIITVGGAFSYYSSVRKTIKDNAEAASAWYNECKKIVNFIAQFDYIAKGFTAIESIKLTKQTIAFAKSLKYADAIGELKQLGGFIKNSYNLFKRVDKARKTYTLAKTAYRTFKLSSLSFKALLATGGSVAAPGLGTIIGFAVGLLIDILLTAVIDYFRYNNVLVLLPLMHHSTPYAPILSGENLLLTGSSNTNVDHTKDGVSGDVISDKVIGTPEKEGDFGEEFNMSEQPKE